MSDTVTIAIIAAATLAILFFVFRTRLTRLLVRYKHIEAELNANPPHSDRKGQPLEGLSISKNKQLGNSNKIEISAKNAEISKNLQKGDSNSLRADNTPK